MKALLLQVTFSHKPRDFPLLVVCDLGQGTLPFQALVSLAVKWAQWPLVL